MKTSNQRDLPLSGNLNKNEPCTVDLTQADLDRGLTPEEIAREKADLNWAGFRRNIVQIINDGLVADQTKK